MRRFYSIFAAFIAMGALIVNNTASRGADDAMRWSLQSDGSIQWSDFSEKSIPHADHIEASGEQVSTVLRYGVDETGAFTLSRSVVWPMLRTIPNNTHASLMRRFDVNLLSNFTVDGAPLSGEKVERISLNGFLTVQSRYSLANGGALQGERKLFPSTKGPFIIERLTLTNASESAITVETPLYRNVTQTDAAQGVNGSYTLVEELFGEKSAVLQKGESARYDFVVQGYSEGKGEKEQAIDFDAEEAARAAFVETMWDELVLDTPEETIDRAFAFAKIRACESVYRTAGGLMHGPGGESYYAAIWANDQAEYANPFFAFMEYPTARESAYNSYRHFARFMNDEYRRIPSSIIAEGIDVWQGAGDRGDQAMIAYGASRYLLARADLQEAQDLWPLVEWCLEYCKRRLNAEGVVESDSDELEGRFPAGDANLCTSCLYYDALTSARYLGKELGVSAAQLEEYEREAATLRENIERYFGATVHGYKTYQYYKGCDLLRSWICVPFVVGIDDRADETIKALFSDVLWTENGLLTQEGSATFWDRSTLYALRGVFAVGAEEIALEKLRYYSRVRLLGEHVPYPIEAWPEGSQRHLSAESALYCRVITEGLFGIRPTGFHKFETTPRLPKEWPSMELKNVRAFGKTFDLLVSRADDGQLRVEARLANGDAKEYAIQEGETLEIEL